MNRSVVTTEHEGRWDVQMFIDEERVWCVENLSREQAQQVRSHWLDGTSAQEPPGTV